MTSKCKLLATVGFIALIAGCGGGSDVGVDAPSNGGVDAPGGSGGDPPTLDTFSEIEAAAAAMAANYLDPEGNPLSTVDITVAAIAPGEGATYNGFVGGEINGGALNQRRLVGELELVVTFNGPNPGLVTGSADNFFDSSDVEYGGILNVDGDTLNPNQLSAIMAGNLNDGTTVYGVDVALEGDFFGTEPDAVGGNAVGLIRNGADFNPFIGAFIAER